MRLRDGGRIISISSGAVRVAMPEIIAYSATKGALDNFTLTLAKELGPRGITVNAVAPGITDINADWLRGNAGAEGQAASLAALGRVGQPEDIAGVVAFLASDDARWVTGRVIDATGGPALRPPGPTSGGRDSDSQGRSGPGPVVSLRTAPA